MTYTRIDENCPVTPIDGMKFMLSDVKVLDEDGVGDTHLIRVLVKTIDNREYDLCAPLCLLDYMRDFLKQCDEKLGKK